MKVKALPGTRVRKKANPGRRPLTSEKRSRIAFVYELSRRSGSDVPHDWELADRFDLCQNTISRIRTELGIAANDELPCGMPEASQLNLGRCGGGRHTPSHKYMDPEVHYVDPD